LNEHTTWLTATEAAQHLKIKPRTILQWVRQGKVKAFALSGTKRRVWRFRREDLDDVVATRKCRINCNEILSPPIVN
jgi:excisionase family DNA binding protein